MSPSPGTSREELRELLKSYEDVGQEGLWRNLEYFLKAVIPEAEKAGVRMAMHPDDPCWPIFNLPRIITNEESIDRFLAIKDSPYNALTLCTGSLGCEADNDLPKLISKYAAADRIAFGHVRNVKRISGRSFEESAHFSKAGSLDMAEIMKAYYDAGYQGYIVCPLVEEDEPSVLLAGEKEVTGLYISGHPMSHYEALYPKYGAVKLIRLTDPEVNQSYDNASVFVMGMITAKRLKLTKGGENMAFLTLEVRKSNAPAIALYEKFGFQRAGLRPGYYQHPREDAVIMTREFREAP